MIGSYKVITLCGSTRFKEEFEKINADLTLSGHIVISVGIFGHANPENERLMTPEVKTMLDDIHKRKIDMADAVFIINKDGYIGKSTRSEIEYAMSHGKEVLYLEKPADSTTA